MGAGRLKSLVRVYLPQHFNQRGLPKRRFESVGEAAMFRKQASEGVKRKRIYLCPLCDGYHLGGTNARGRRAARG
jgi:hypothetical protein